MGSGDNGDLAELASMVGALVRWEEEISGGGFPEGVAPGVSEAPVGASVVGPEPPSSEPAPAMPAAVPGGATPDPLGRLAVLADEAAACTACGLHEGRTRSVFSRGNPAAELVFVGEGPGYHEDQQGVPFVGKAGQLLDKMVDALGYERDGVYICNVVKCRPPQNRTPTLAEARACDGFLTAQLAVVQPRVIVALGRCATENLGCIEPDARGWRGVWSEWKGIPVMPTYHPAFLLRSPQFKRAVWDDLKKVLASIGRALPERPRK